MSNRLIGVVGHDGRLVGGSYSGDMLIGGGFYVKEEEIKRAWEQAQKEWSVVWEKEHGIGVVGPCVVDVNMNPLPFYWMEDDERYIMRNPKFGMFGDWCGTVQRTKSKFGISREKNRFKVGSGTLKEWRNFYLNKHWHVCDHKGRKWAKGIDRNWRLRIPKEAGKYAVLLRHGGEEYTILKSTGTAWMNSMRALWQFAGNNGVTGKWLYVVKTLGDGKVVISEML